MSNLKIENKNQWNEKILYQDFQNVGYSIIRNSKYFLENPVNFGWFCMKAGFH